MIRPPVNSWPMERRQQKGSRGARFTIPGRTTRLTHACETAMRKALLAAVLLQQSVGQLPVHIQCTQQQMVTLATCLFDCKACAANIDGVFAATDNCMLIGGLTSRFGHLTASDAILATCDVIISIDPSRLERQARVCPVYEVSQLDRTENWWDARNGTGSCAALMDAGRTCAHDFCESEHVCPMSGYCDRTCGFCTSRQNETVSIRKSYLRL